MLDESIWRGGGLWMLGVAGEGHEISVLTGRFNNRFVLGNKLMFGAANASLAYFKAGESRLAQYDSPVALHRSPPCRLTHRQGTCKYRVENAQNYEGGSAAIRWQSRLALAPNVTWTAIPITGATRQYSG